MKMVVDNYSNYSPIGCFLEADLDYPGKVNDMHNGYCLTTKKVKVAKEMLSKYQFHIVEDTKFSLCKTRKRYS